VNTDKSYKEDKLKKLRRLRFYGNFPILAFIILAVLNVIAPDFIKPLVSLLLGAAVIWFFLTFFMNFKIYFYRCPRCNERFHLRPLNRETKMVHFYNPFTQKCLNCGLQIDGSNIESDL
jgi:hypothetical protein